MMRDAADTRRPPPALDIVVATARDQHSETLFRELQRTRSRVRHVWPLHARLPDSTDVIFCDATPEILRLIPWVPGEPTAALVAIVGPMTDCDIVRGASPDAVLHRPFTPQAVLMSLMLAREHFAYTGRLRQRIQKLDETSRMIRSVERAKTLLMTSRKMREEEAYSFIRSQAMTRRVSIGAFASVIIESGDLLG